MAQNNIFALTDRCLIRLAGPDAEDFLQNVITNDIRQAVPGRLLYACLLTPQGQYLHDFFILRDAEGFLLDVEAARAEDLLRRFTMFRLRAKVSFTRLGNFCAYAGTGIADPRLAELPPRLYTAESFAAAREVQDYHDFCIGLGVPCGSLAMTARDTMADVNLDLLQAVAWDKGCFIGQEVAARMYHRNLAKRRLMIIDGAGLSPGEKLRRGNIEAGDIRQVASTGNIALAQLKISGAQQAPLTRAAGGEVTIRTPHYLAATLPAT